MINFAYHAGCKSILELGAGLTTGLFTKYARNTGAHFQSIDSNFSSMLSYIAETDLEPLVTRHLERHEGFTITAERLKLFYKEPRDAIGKVPLNRFVHFLDKFSRPHVRWKAIEKMYRGSKKLVRKILLDKHGRLLYPTNILNLFSRSMRYEKEISLLESHDTGISSDIIVKLIDDGNTWDFVLFDSGELSSIIEWELLKDHIKIGGFAAFHDIYFPKSIKNFVVCASILGDPNWKPIYIDDTTAQGGFVAQRVR
jgi:hypothetical protein